MNVNSLIRNLRTSKYASLWIALVFAAALFSQCCLFHYFSQGMSVFSCFEHPQRIVSIYLQKVAISIFIASFVFLFRRKYWVVWFLVVHTIWILTECVYLQAFDGMLIDAYGASMASNLEGFTDSIFMYLHRQYLWLLLPLVVMGITIYCFDNRQNFQWLPLGVSILIAMLLDTAHSAFISSRYKNESLVDIPIWKIWNPITSDLIETSTLTYTGYYSSIHAFFRVGYEMMVNTEKPVDIEALTKKMQPFVRPMAQNPVPQNKLVIFLVESLENWAILPEITPNICQYMDTHEVLYAGHVKKQTKKGHSMDGQLLVNTGFLPLRSGASCFRFPHNRYPSLSELYSNSAILVPGGPSVWNQVAISKSCGIDTNYMVTFNDAEIFRKYEEVMNEHDYVMVLTSSSHSPFRAYADSSNIELPSSMPELMRNYLKTINFMDRYLGDALQKIEKSDKLRDAVVVITGDHTIFSENYRKEFDEYCQVSGDCRYKVNEAYCPLIIGGIEKSIYITEEVYQMDIYPTILHAIGCESFYWKGWGVNLLDSAACANRSIQEDDAYVMADKVIRSNWFEVYENGESQK